MKNSKSLKDEDIDSINLKNLDLNNINILDDKFYEDHEIIEKNCKCFTCSNGYTKAYINHLFKCNELNGNILVLMHNIYKTNEMIQKFEAVKQLDKIKFIIEFLKTNCINVNVEVDENNDILKEINLKENDEKEIDK